MAATSEPLAAPARRSSSDDYGARKAWIAEYFDRTAAQAWAQLTSDAPVGRVRATVRAGRDRMRATLLGWMPEDMRGMRVLDAGCGTGALAIELARRGAHVVAIDLSPTLVSLAAERTPRKLISRIDYRSGDMLDAALGQFSYVVAMDSIIHYRQRDMLTVLAAFMARADRGVLFTVAPRTALLTTLFTVGKLFPRGDRAPSIEPVATDVLRATLAATAPGSWSVDRGSRIASGFYTSEAIELVNAGGTSLEPKVQDV